MHQIRMLFRIRYSDLPRLRVKAFQPSNRHYWDFPAQRKSAYAHEKKSLILGTLSKRARWSDQLIKEIQDVQRRAFQ